MYQFSDSDTTDSDDGIRFKTATTRDKQRRNRSRSPARAKYLEKTRYRSRSRSRSRSPKSRHFTRHTADKDKLSDAKHKKSLESEKRDKPHKEDSRVISGKPTSSSSSTLKTSNQPFIQVIHEIRDKVRESQVPCNSLSIDDAANVDENVAGINICGPALPPYLAKNAEETICGPALPPRLIRMTESATRSPSLPPRLVKNIEDVSCGPALPPRLLKNTEIKSDDGSDEQTICGPSLPPHLLKRKPSEDLTRTDVGVRERQDEERAIGPFIPAHLRKQLAEAEQTVDHTETNEDDPEEDDCYGPLPPEVQHKSQAHLALEERALQIKLDQLAPQNTHEPGREEWMTELPTVQAANLGLGPRQFRAKAGPDLSDRSSWTDAPNDKAKKAKVEKIDLQKEAEINAMRKRDQEQDEMIKKARKKNKRDKSLMDQHQEKLSAKKKADKEKGANVRRPFDREVDLKVNHFDEAQKKSMMKKAQLLDDRFSHGQTKYL